MIDCNIRGGLMVITGLAIGFAVGGLTSQLSRSDSLPFALAAFVALPVPTVWDLYYRRRHNGHLGRWRYILSDAGGNFMFLPVWVWFGGVPVVGNIVWLIGKVVGLA